MCSYTGISSVTFFPTYTSLHRFVTGVRTAILHPLQSLVLQEVLAFQDQSQFVRYLLTLVLKNCLIPVYSQLKKNGFLWTYTMFAKKRKYWGGDGDLNFLMSLSASLMPSGSFSLKLMPSCSLEKYFLQLFLI